MTIANSTQTNDVPAAAAQRLQSALVELVARPEPRGPERRQIRQQHSSQVAQLLQAYRELMKMKPN